MTIEALTTVDRGPVVTVTETGESDAGTGFNRMLPMGFAILLLVYSMVAPVTPGKMLGASLVAASLDPLGVWLAYLRGVAVPSPVQTFVLFWANYVCAGLATIPSHFLRQVARKLHKARELGSYELVLRGLCAKCSKPPNSGGKRTWEKLPDRWSNRLGSTSKC